LRIQLEIWQRDNWHCRYCGCPVFYARTLKLMSNLNPNHSYFHSNGKSGELLPLFQWSWASVDHVRPFAKGGEDMVDNYVTACWQCNLKYRDKEVGVKKPIPNKIIDSNWDGFFGLYKILEQIKHE